ncbi:MAG: bifunctional demethylmenaquinone methyltransferase/2-methoxy-6-polyprenyl-1,4-benzoquinol methylase UbiE [candidate division Zixibacteria bacterium]|nr:bifunctional demethylmenaquinone methyltransferase/2-methoxy-6-polyprenyl-1,4-benzoquinol methylase UbiE [candidate division Zixibacteria bacterium]NIW47091.1 bifunctional demethylmenaquinone methyltransferase/2-methoxy-6-polyprenyl-1,4-benzoquinol methylase UbiE [Gammaproteobacteria bacterium]NIX58073.1 bifunctional demethylmenaquinone methyltransferase/2-methoxy-6-polyprenyl-1,4-benzoquinol methylase UbiE [candidate division Zixibacteria bacterium]
MSEKPLKDRSDKEKIDAVRDIFGKITPNYDRMNRIMSARRDVSWRRFLVRRIPSDALKVLDVATGTGDVAIEIARRRPEIQVTGLDFVQEMLNLAIEKTEKDGLVDKIEYINGDAMAMPFEDSTFDVSTIAFGMRNIPDRLGAIKEMARVVKPRGKVLILEMTFPKNLKMRQFFHWYLNKVIPVLGTFIAGNRSAYRYLSDSIQNFIHPDQLTDLFRQAGLQEVREYPLTMGITYLHEGIVP